MAHSTPSAIRGTVLTVHARLALLFTMTAGMCVLPTQAQEPAGNADGTAIWSGVYTMAQAARGQTRYEASCRSCHQDGPRRADAFMREWGGTGLESVFNLIKVSMPAGAPSSLSDDAYLDIVAYMLQVNAFPSGGTELTAGAIKSIKIEGRNGPEPVPNFALVAVVGCLAQGADAAWMLLNAGEPTRARDPAASKEEELKSAQAVAPGTRKFSLLNVYPPPDSYKGQKVEAKGLLIRDPAGDRINVTSVQALAPRCE
jgi:mono/diheme cytochrome c family protein